MSSHTRDSKVIGTALKMEFGET